MAFIATLFAVLIYGIHRHYHQAYLICALLTMTKLPTQIEGFGNDLIVHIIELGLGLLVFCIARFLKFKLFPYMSLSGGSKKVLMGSILLQCIANKLFNRYETLLAFAPSSLILAKDIFPD